MENVFFSHKKDDWSTPSYIYKYFMKNGYYDPCPLFCQKDALSYNWPSFNFVNPPYSKLIEFVNFACDQVWYHKVKVVLLLPVRTETRWFKRLFDFGGSAFVFCHGRLKFGGLVTGFAPFGSVLVFLGWSNLPKMSLSQCRDGSDIKRICSTLGVYHGS